MPCALVARAAVPLFLVACVGTRPLPLRADLTSVATTSSHLDGIRAAVASVRDARVEHSVGRHRDGLARVVHWHYAPPQAVDVTVRGMAMTALRNAGAVIVSPDDADLRFDVDVVDLDVTDDAPLAGEETFGRVALRVVVTERSGHVLSDHVSALAFADPERADPGLLGEAMYAALTNEVASLRRPIAMR